MEATLVLDAEEASVAIVGVVHDVPEGGVATQSLLEHARQPSQLDRCAIGTDGVLGGADKEHRRVLGMHSKRIELQADLLEALGRLAQQLGQREDEDGDGCLGGV